MKPNEKQLEKIRKHLLKEETVTSWDAIENYRITRLSAYINLLRQEMSIRSLRIYPPNANWYTLYILNK